MPHYALALFPGAEGEKERLVHTVCTWVYIILAEGYMEELGAHTNI